MKYNNKITSILQAVTVSVVTLCESTLTGLLIRLSLVRAQQAEPSRKGQLNCWPFFISSASGSVSSIRSPLFAICEGEVMSAYKLTFTVTIEEQDDPAARKHAKGIIEALGEVVSGAEVKLQQVHQDKPPRGVRMG
jgi:hypothetical protein